MNDWWLNEIHPSEHKVIFMFCQLLSGDDTFASNCFNVQQLLQIRKSDLTGYHLSGEWSLYLDMNAITSPILSNSGRCVK